MKIAEHDGGHLPFDADVTQMLHYGEENRITVAVNNTLSDYTLPVGSWNWMPANKDMW